MVHHLSLITKSAGWYSNPLGANLEGKYGTVSYGSYTSGDANAKSLYTFTSFTVVGK